MTEISKESIKRFVIELIEENGKLPTNVDLETFNYIDNGYVDSIGIIKFIVEIGEKYGVELEDSDIERGVFKTIGGIVKIIQEKLTLL
jgi:acyl carrier protein